MHVFVTGGTGLIGRSLVKRLVMRGDEVTVLTRQSLTNEHSVTYITDIDQLERVADVVVNLAGEGLAEKRWTERYKQKIRASRVGLTETLVSHLTKMGAPKVFLSGSAIGYYGASESEQFSEQAPSGVGFGANLCVDWEQSARLLDQQGTRCVLLRTGVVLDKHVGAYPQMTQSFKFGVASWMGRGNHWLSWIHLEDMVNGILHCMDTDSISGPVNMTSPQAISHKSFSDAVSAQKRCFIEMGIPAGLMRLLLGEMADELLLTGQHVVPTVLTNTGFAFNCPTIEAAITALET
jgi:uncharacterized protein (TIGR01777 family)